MTIDKKFKRRVRAYAAEQGIGYQEARRRLSMVDAARTAVGTFDPACVLCDNEGSHVGRPHVYEGQE